MDANNINSFVSGITSNLNGLLGELEKLNKQTAQNLTPEQAIELKDAFDNYKITEKVEAIKKQAYDAKVDIDI